MNRVISNMFSCCYICRNDLKQDIDCMACGISILEELIISFSMIASNTF